MESSDGEMSGGRIGKEGDGGELDVVDRDGVVAFVASQVDIALTAA